MDNRTDEIRDLAYALWVEAGSPQGQSEHYWLKAERQLADEGELDLSEEQDEVQRPPLLAGLPPVM